MLLDYRKPIVASRRGSRKGGVRAGMPLLALVLEEASAFDVDRELNIARSDDRFP
jgi:hypothetical protein